MCTALYRTAPHRTAPHRTAQRCSVSFLYRIDTIINYVGDLSNFAQPMTNVQPCPAMSSQLVTCIHTRRTPNPPPPPLPSIYILVHPHV